MRDEYLVPAGSLSPHGNVGLHVKAGIDTNTLSGRVNAASGRLRYDGHAVQRACRIASIAVSEQVSVVPCIAWCRWWDGLENPTASGFSMHRDMGCNTPLLLLGCCS
jgi:hypothetical protein